MTFQIDKDLQSKIIMGKKSVYISQGCGFQKIENLKSKPKKMLA